MKQFLSQVKNIFTLFLFISSIASSNCHGAKRSLSLSNSTDVSLPIRRLAEELKTNEEIRRRKATGIAKLLNTLRSGGNLASDVTNFLIGTAISSPVIAGLLIHIYSKHTQDPIEKLDEQIKSQEKHIAHLHAIELPTEQAKQNLLTMLKKRESLIAKRLK